VLIIFALTFTTGCIKNIKTPSDTIKSPEYNEKDKIFNLYKKHLRENESPEVLIEFLRDHIDELSQENADIAVTRVIEFQESLLPRYEEKALENSEELAKLNIDEEEHDLGNETQELIIDAKKNGYKITQTNIKIDYEKINTITANYLSDELKDYIKIESDDYGNDENIFYNYSEKEYLDELTKLDKLAKIKLDNYLNELAKRISQTYIYIEKHENSPHLLRVKELRKMYLEFYLFGSPNNPSFEHYKGNKFSNNKLKNEWKMKYIHLEEDSKNWKNTLKNSDNSPLSKPFSVEMDNYINELDKNNFMLNEKTNEEIDTIINYSIN
jgi:hypothetical protein